MKSSGTTVPGQTATTEIDFKTAEVAARILLQELGDGQFQRMYSTLHPSQQALVTVEQFDACYSANAPRTEITGVKFKEHYSEQIGIPGTTEHAQAVALTTQFTADGDTATATFHVVKVGESWRWTMQADTIHECETTEP